MSLWTANNTSYVRSIENPDAHVLPTCVDLGLSDATVCIGDYSLLLPPSARVSLTLSQWRGAGDRLLAR